MQFTYQVANHQWSDNGGDVAKDVKDAATEANNLFGAVSEITGQPRAPNPLPKKASAISMTTSVVLLV
ncbi:hypothetical protein ACLK19_20925 [Escherichia coli]